MHCESVGLCVDATPCCSQNAVLNAKDKADAAAFADWLVVHHGMYFSVRAKGHYVRQIYVNVHHPNIRCTAHGHGYRPP